MSNTMAERFEEAARLVRRYQPTYHDAALAFMRATVEQANKTPRSGK